MSKSRRKSVQKRAVRAGLLAGNAAILVGIGLFVLQNPNTSTSSASLLGGTEQATAAANPLDQVSSADIALTVARLSSLPEATAINNQADSQAIELSLAPTNNSVVSKPQVVATELKSRADIHSYAAVDGDSISSIAVKFGVTSDSIRWSNNMTGETVSAGTMMTIPPVNGIVYTVADGDTPDSLATKFKANKDQIIAYNDGEIAGLKVGDRILIPNGTQAAPVVTARSIVTSNTSSTASSSYAWGGNTAIYGSNGYDYGYCTWYVASKMSIPSNWGNANTWDNLAPLSGWTVSSTPRAGAIAQSDSGFGYLGHVAYVDAVSEDGSMIKYSDMNNLAGWGRIGYSEWVPASSYSRYIYR